MTKQVQLRRGTNEEHAVFTGAVGELTIDTTLDVAVVHDGSKAGGYPLVGTTAPQEITGKLSVGIGTTDATSELTVYGDAYIRGYLDTEYLNINDRLPLSKNGIVSSFSSNKITGIDTSGVRIGDTIIVGSGRTVGVGSTSTVIDFGPSVLLLQDNFADYLVVYHTGSYQFAESINIIGIGTTGIQVGYAVTGDYVPDNTQVLSIGVQQVTITNPGTNPFPGLYVADADTTSGSNIITEVSEFDISNIAVGAYVRDLDNPTNIPEGTVVLSKGIDTITISNNATLTASLVQLEYTVYSNFAFAPTPSNESFTILDTNAGKGIIPEFFSDVSDIDTAFISTSYVNQSNINTGIITSAIITDAGISTSYTNISNINVGIITEALISGANITTSYTNEANIGSGIITSATVSTGLIEYAFISTSFVDQSNVNIGFTTSAIITEAGITSSYTNVANINSGIITSIAVQSGTISTVGITTSYTNFANINVGIVTEALISQANISTSYTNQANINIGIVTNITIDEAIISRGNISTSYIGDANINVGIITSATISEAIITNVGVSTLSTNIANINTGIITDVNITTANIAVQLASFAQITTSYTDQSNINVGIITSGTIGTVGITSSYTNVANINTGIITSATIETADIISGTISTVGITTSYTNVANINVGIITDATITSLTGQNSNIVSSNIDNLTAGIGVVTYFSATNANVSGISTLGDVKIGTGNTTLIVDGSARITGILTIGSSSITLNGNNSNISGINSISGNVGVFTNIQVAGINTFTSLRTNVTLKTSQLGIATDYELILPPRIGQNGQLLGLNADGTLGFATGTGLYENRYYVSSVNGDDANDGKTLPVRTIKRASQLASFDSFVIPGQRYLDAGNLLESNKDFIKEESIAYVEFNYENIGVATIFPDYESSSWKAGITSVIDALTYDIRFGGNSKSREIGINLVNSGTFAGEEEPLIFALDYIKFISQYIINNQSPPTLYQFPLVENQTFDFTIIDDPENTNSNYFHRSKDARNLIVGNRQEIIDKSLASVAIAATSGFYFPGEEETNERSRYYDSYKLIQINRQEIIDYAWNATVAAYPGISATEAKCKRDLGYFVDAVSTDVFTGGNNYVRSFAGFYFDAVGNPISNGLLGEETESVYAFGQAKVGMSSAICNLLTNKDLTITADPETGSNTDPNSCANVRSTISTLVGIVTSVISAGSTAGIGNTTNYGYFLVNSEFNVRDFVGIGTTNVVGGRKCARDLGYIIDAVAQDIAYGTNQHIIYATKKYFDGAGAARTDGLLGEEVISGYAFTSLAYYSKLAVTNQLNYQDLTIQVDAGIGTNKGSLVCANTQSTIDNLVGILTTAVLTGSLSGISSVNLGITDCADVRSSIVNYVGIVTTIIGFGTASAPELSAPSTQSQPVCIIVEAGNYVEDNPIILYDDVAVVGDNLRNTIIRPANAGKDLFRVRNGIYLTGFAMKDSIDLAGIPQNTFNYAVAFDDPTDPLTSRAGYATKLDKPTITRSPYIQNCSILSFLGGNGMLVDGNKVLTPNVPLISEEVEVGPDDVQPEQGKSMVAAAFTMVSFGGIGWRVINDGYSQVVSCFQIFCRYGSLAQSGGYLSITNSATNFGLFALRSTGFSRNSFVFDRGRIAATGTSGGLQTLKAVGYGRSDVENYILRFFDGNGVDRTSLFKPAVITREFDGATGVGVTDDTITIVTHGFNNADSVIYNGDEQVIPNRIIGGLVNDNQYYVIYIDANTFKLAEDESLQTIVDLTSISTGIHTFTKASQEFFVKEIIDSHNSYQKLTLAGVGSTASFVSGRLVTQTVTGGTASGYAVTYNNTTRELLVSLEISGGIRRNFGVTNGTTILNIEDHSPSPISIGVSVVAGITTYWTVEFKTDSTISGTLVQNIGTLPETYKLHFHRPSIINSSSHTWEYSGSGVDYNALPQNGGQSDPRTEQISELGGRVYSSGTNELGDFKIGDSITAFNRTGNIIFNNTVTIGTLDSIRLSLSGGNVIEEFSTDTDLGDNEIGGPRHTRVPTQLSTRTFLNNRLGDFIDKNVSTNAIPNSIVQLNSIGQINPDLIPPKTVNYYRASVDGGRTQLVNFIPATNLLSGDTVVEPTDSFVLITDTVSQYLVLSNSNIYNFENGDTVTSVTSGGGAIGVVTAPPLIGVGLGTTTLSFPKVGYGTTGLVRGVALTLNGLSGGSGYTNPGIYTGVRLDTSTGIGTGLTATITVGGSGTVTNVAINTGGYKFSTGDVLTLNDPTPIGGRTGGSNFAVTVSSVETRLYMSLVNNQKFPGSAVLSDFVSDRNAVAISTNIGIGYTVSFNPTDYLTGGDIDFINDRIIIGAGHDFSDGDPVIYNSGGGVAINPLLNNTTYYIKTVGVSSVQLYSTYALVGLRDLTSSGTLTHSLSRVGVNTLTDQITFKNHGLSQGEPVRVSGNTPVGVTTNNFYFVGSVTVNSFTFHESRAQALASINGVLLNTVDLSGALASDAVGIMTLTEQNVEYSATVNTSSTSPDNWSLLSASSLDAANIVSGVFDPSRLGSGTANDQTFLRGDSSYQKVVTAIGIGTTQPIGVVATTSDLAPGGVGLNTYYGKINLTLNRVQTSSDEFSTLGVSRFKSSTFTVGSDGAVSIKNSITGDIDAATLGGQNSAYYLDIANTTGTLPITRGGTNLTAAPSLGFILIGNGSSYNLTGSPEFAGVVGAGFTVLTNKDISFANSNTWTGEKDAKIQYFSGSLYNQYTSSWILRNSGGTNVVTVSAAGTGTYSGLLQATRFTSTVSTGTAPLTVTSTTQVANLNASLLEGYSTDTANTANRIVRRDASGNFSAGTITATLSGNSAAVTSFDTRSTNPNPQDYAQRVTFDFKTNTTNGLSDGGTYNGVMSWRKYGTSTDFSGGPMIQLAYTDNGNLYTRLSTGNTTWGSWTKIWNDNNDGSGSGLDADLLDGLNSATANTASTIVARDASGNFSAGTITASLTGNVTGNLTGNVTGTLTRTVTGTNTAELIRGNMASSDQFRILVGGTATDAGYVEFATADNGNEPIYLRQYTGAFTTIQRTATLLDASGNTTFPGTVTAQSDIRLKSNINTIEKALEKVLKLRGVEYDRIDMNNKHQIGVIAQEVEEVFPELVLENDDGIKSVAYGNMVAILIEAIKEQQKQIEELKIEIENLKGK